MNWDYLIVGAGSGGCAVAERLSRSGTYKVIVLEAGPTNKSAAIKIPARLGFVDVRKFDWGYTSRPDPTRNGRVDRWLSGRVVGGSSSINGMNYVRGSDADFDRWGTAGISGWRAVDVKPIYSAMECCDPNSIPESPLRGRQGPLKVRMVREPHLITRAFIQAAGSVGVAFNPDYNANNQEGIGYAQLTQSSGMRWSAADAFLRPALRRRNFSMQAGCSVHRLVIRGNTVLGAIVERDGELHEIRAQRTILCAGALNTPKILMLSGIGRAALLRQHDVQVVCDRPAVGENLQDHPLLQLTFAARVPTYNLTGGVWQRARFIGQYLRRREGPIASIFEAIGFLRTREDLASPDLQLHVQPLGYSGQGDGKTFASRMSARSCFTVLINMSYPSGRGRVALAGRDPRLAPLIEPRLLDNVADVETLVRGVRIVRRIVSANPIADLIEEEVEPGAGLLADEDLKNFVVDNAGIAYHPAGTCRMGPDEAAVTRPDLSVRGLDNLWIADASVMPDLISGNTNGVSMMIGRKLGEQLCPQ